MSKISVFAGLFGLFLFAVAVCAPIIFDDRYGTGLYITLSVIVFLITCAPALVVLKRKALKKDNQIYGVGVIVLVFCGIGLFFWAFASVWLLDVAVDSLAGKLDMFLAPNIERREWVIFDFMFISLGFIIAVGLSLFGAFIAWLEWLFLRKEKSKG